MPDTIHMYIVYVYMYNIVKKISLHIQLFHKEKIHFTENIQEYPHWSLHQIQCNYKKVDIRYSYHKIDRKTQLQAKSIHSENPRAILIYIQ